MKTIAKRTLYFLIGAAIILTQFSCSKEDNSRLFSYQPPAQEDLKTQIQNEILTMKEAIKHLPEFDGLNGYKAGRMNDISICNEAYAPSQCRKAARVVTDMKALAEGKCDSIVHNILRDMELCNHLRNGTCFMLTDWQKKLCEGFYEGDYNTLKQILNYSSFKQQEDPPKEKGLLQMFSIYMGFKNKEGIKGCTRLIPLLKGSDRFICDVIFGSEDVNTVLDNIAQDMAIFYVAKKYKSLNLCSKIKDKEIKSNCFDPRITTLYYPK